MFKVLLCSLSQFSSFTKGNTISFCRLFQCLLGQFHSGDESNLRFHQFCFISLHHWSKKIAPSSQSAYQIQKISCALKPFACVYFEFWLAPWDIVASLFCWAEVLTSVLILRHSGRALYKIILKWIFVLDNDPSFLTLVLLMVYSGEIMKKTTRS